MNFYRVVDDYVGCIFEDFDIEGYDYIGDVVHEVVDGCEEVIYYHKAHELVQSLSSDDEAAAVDNLHALGVQPESYDDWAVKIAYEALYQHVYQGVLEKLEELEDADE